jgi:hypothetical protein
MGISAYPKIFALGTRHIQEIFNGPIEITEKIDGSQFAFGKIEGELLMRSRGRAIYEESCDNLFNEAVASVVPIKDIIPDNTIFYGEYLKKPKHNCIAYDRFPSRHIALFGMCDPLGNFDSKYEALQEYAEVFGVDVVPRLHNGEPPDDPLALLQTFMDTDSYLGGSKVEGIVVKRYGEFLIAGQPRTVMAGKYVSEEFKERNQAGFKKGSSRNVLLDFMDTFRTEARWRKGVQHLAEDGELLNEPKDIGKILKAIHQDIVDEEKEYISQWLYTHFIKDIKRAACRGFAEWYKEYLLKESL